MKTVEVVFIQNGEINGTWGVHGFLENFKGDLKEKCQRLISNDMWEPIEVPLYKTRQVRMCDWMDDFEFKRREVDLKFAVALGGDFVYHYNEVQFDNFCRLGEKYKFLIGWLEEKRGGRNTFYHDLLRQVDRWLLEEDHSWPTPLSLRQFEAASKYCPLYNAKKISTRAYYDRT